jgi:hypothetical protein
MANMANVQKCRIAGKTLFSKAHRKCKQFHVTNENENLRQKFQEGRSKDATISTGC